MFAKLVTFEEGIQLSMAACRPVGHLPELPY